MVIVVSVHQKMILCMSSLRLKVLRHRVFLVDTTLIQYFQEDI